LCCGRHGCVPQLSVAQADHEHGLQVVGHHHLLVDRPKLVAFRPVSTDVELEHEAVRRVVGSLCVAQAVRHVDPASIEAVYAARMHLVIAGIAAHRKHAWG